MAQNAELAQDDASFPGPARQNAARRAAADSVAAGRLLPGEVEDSAHPEDARHWIAVYSELLDFKKTLIETTRKAGEQLAEAAAREEIDSTDAVMAKAESERFARRLGFWRRRLEELSGGRP